MSLGSTSPILVHAHYLSHTSTIHPTTSKSASLVYESQTFTTFKDFTTTILQKPSVHEKLWEFSFSLANDAENTNSKRLPYDALVPASIQKKKSPGAILRRIYDTMMQRAHHMHLIDASSAETDSVFIASGGESGTASVYSFMDEEVDTVDEFPLDVGEEMQEPRRTPLMPHEYFKEWEALCAEIKDYVTKEYENVPFKSFSPVIIGHRTLGNKMDEETLRSIRLVTVYEASQDRDEYLSGCAGASKFGSHDEQLAVTLEGFSPYTENSAVLLCIKTPSDKLFPPFKYTLEQRRVWTNILFAQLRLFPNLQVVRLMCGGDMKVLILDKLRRETTITTLKASEWNTIKWNNREINVKWYNRDDENRQKKVKNALKTKFVRFERIQAPKSIVDKLEQANPSVGGHAQLMQTMRNLLHLRNEEERQEMASFPDSLKPKKQRKSKHGISSKKQKARRLAKSQHQVVIEPEDEDDF